MSYKSIGITAKSSTPKTAQEYAEVMLHLRNDYEDSIPLKIVSGKDTHHKATHKVQHNWWQMLILYLDLMNEDLAFPEPLKNEIATFICTYTSESFKRKIRTTREDVDVANSIIEKCIAAIKDLDIIS